MGERLSCNQLQDWIYITKSEKNKRDPSRKMGGLARVISIQFVIPNRDCTMLGMWGGEGLFKWVKIPKIVVPKSVSFKEFHLLFLEKADKISRGPWNCKEKITKRVNSNAFSKIEGIQYFLFISENKLEIYLISILTTQTLHLHKRPYR